MRRIQEMRIIEIDITNACIHKCSNCTRMCAHYPKPYFMDFDTFKNAIDSLKDFEGRIGIMGGEPLLHPQFDQFVKYAGDVIDTRMPHDPHFHAPKIDYFSAMNRRTLLSEVATKARGLVLLSSVPKQYYRHYEQITDTFSQYILNDHSNPSYHQSAMIAYKDLGISDEEFIRLRDQCWLQEIWSAGITYKGAFFCEVAGVLDLLFDGPGGWKVEPDWWKREISDYKDQLHWCEICGVCLDTNTRNANDEIDDASESVYKMLEEIDSPAIKKERVQIYRSKEQDTHSEATLGGNYISDDKDRINTARENLLAQRIEAVKQGDFQTLWEPDGMINNPAGHDWIILMINGEDAELTKVLEKLQNRFLNPGVLYQIKTEGINAYMWNAAASVLREGKNFAACPKDAEELWEKWSPEKRYIIEEITETDPIDEMFYEQEIYKAYKSDERFIKTLYERLKGLPKEKPVLIPMTAPSPYVRALASILKEAGQKVAIIASHRHKEQLQGIVPDENLILHPQHKFIFDELKDFTNWHPAETNRKADGKADNEADRKVRWAGYLMPVLSPADHLLERDGYGDVMKLMEQWGIHPIGIINAKRKFCEI